MLVDIKKVKVVVFVPRENLEKVRVAMCSAGAGKIGNYDYCTATTKSVGTFIPNDNANPYIGQAKNLEIVEEEKLEGVCDIEKVKQVLTAIKKAHPYEEPAIKVFIVL